jgi:hypothetical protein
MVSFIRLWYDAILRFHGYRAVVGDQNIVIPERT